MNDVTSSQVLVIGLGGCGGLAVNSIRVNLKPDSNSFIFVILFEPSCNVVG